MANKNTRRLNALKHAERAQKRKANPEYREAVPKRLTKPKNMDLYRNFPGFRKDRDKVAA